MKAKVSTGAPRKISVLVVDDQPVFREGVARILGEERDLLVRGEAADAIEGIKRAQALKPELAIIDIALDGLSSINLIKSFRAKFPRMKILVFSTHREKLYAERALRAGANGYLLKKADGRELVAAVRGVLSGRTYLSDALQQAFLSRVADGGQTDESSPVDRLSDREIEVLQRIGHGYGSRQIADELHVSIKTVESHREHIRQKMNLQTTFELVQYAIRWVHEGASTRIPRKS